MGFSTGFNTVGSLTPAVGDQLNDVPLLVRAGLAPVVPVQIFKGPRFDIVGKGFTVIVKLLMSVQEPVVAVSVYVVVWVGVSTGLAIEVLLIPATAVDVLAVQVNVAALLVVVVLKELPAQIAVLVFPVSVRLFC